MIGWVTRSFFDKPRQLIRFLCVGVLNTFAGLFVIYTAKWFFYMGDVIANVLGYSVGLCVSFALNSRWTFLYRGSRLKAMARFSVAMFLAYLLNLMTVLFCIDYLRVNSYLAQAIGMPVFTVSNYLLCKFFVFK